MPRHRIPYTSAAAEFYVLSILNRLEIDASLTFGNTKKVDIVVQGPGGKTLTIDSKGAESNRYFILGKNLYQDDRNHFFALVYFNKVMNDIATLPEVYIMPSDEAAKYTHRDAGSGIYQVRPNAEFKERFRDAWALLFRDAEAGSV